MPYNLDITGSIETKGAALYNPNFLGHLYEGKRHQWERFTGTTIDTSYTWATSVPGTDDSIAISEVQGGSCLITTGTVDNDSCMLSTALIYTADYQMACAWRIKISDVSGTALFVGFSDAKSENNNSIAIHYPDDVLTTVATDGVGFVIDADHSTSSIMCASVKNGTDTTPVDTGIDWADGETKTLVLLTDVDGNALFYIVGQNQGWRIATATTDSTLHCATVQAMTRANDGANTVYVYSFDGWQDDV